MAKRNRAPKGVTKRVGKRQPNATRSAIAAKGWATRRARAEEAIAAQAIIDERNRREEVALTATAALPSPEQQRTMARDKGFKFVLTQEVLLDPEGPDHVLVRVIGRADHAEGCEYRVEYDQGDGRKASRWYPEDRLMALYPGVGCGRL